MESDRKDILKLMLANYSMNILALLNKPKRFIELKQTVKNGRTLSLKLAQLRKYGLIETIGITIDGKYVNSYVVSRKGKSLLKMMDKF